MMSPQQLSALWLAVLTHLEGLDEADYIQACRHLIRSLYDEIARVLLRWAKAE